MDAEHIHPLQVIVHGSLEVAILADGFVIQDRMSDLAADSGDDDAIQINGVANGTIVAHITLAIPSWAGAALPRCGRILHAEPAGCGRRSC